LLLSSNLVITFGKSTDYVIFAFLLHVFAALVLIQSSWSLAVIGLLLLVLVASLCPILRSQKPMPNITGLSRHADKWLLYDKHGQTTSYDHLQIRFDTDLFVLLSLSRLQEKINLVVFCDQLTKDERRMVTIIEKLSIKKK
jgi:hypothetical protein